MKELIEKKFDLISKAQDLVNNAKIEQRALTPEEQQEFNKIREDVENIKETIKIEEEMDNMEEKEVVVENNETRSVEEMETRAFVDYIISELNNRGTDANLTVGNNGAIVPKTIAQKVIAKAYDMSTILSGATKYNTKGNLSIPVYGADGSNDITMAYADEFVELESKIGKFTSVDLGNYLAGALAKLSKSLISNTDIDLVNKVVELMAEAVSRFMERECIKGTNNKVEGLSTVSQGVTTESSTVITPEELIKVKNSVKKAFRKNAKWIMSNDTLTAIETMKDQEGRFLFRDDMSGEFDGYVLGYPVEVSDNMDEIGAGKVVAFFGDYSGLALKQRNDALELNVLREKYATQHCVGVNAWVEFDAKVENYQKISKLTMKA